MKSAFKKFILIPMLGIGILTLENCCYYGGEDCCYNCGDYTEWGFKAVYSDDLDDIVSLEEPRDLQNPGKIYTYENYLLINEKQQGVHIIDNSDPRNPVSVNFLKIVGNNDVAMRNGILYADQFRNLFTIDFSSLATEIAKNRLDNVFDSYSYYDAIPDTLDGYYECPDPSLGIVIDWVADSVQNPCYN